jgi:hypothetical protein
MRELKRLIIAVLALTFLGGVGTGAFIGTLTAASKDRAQSLGDRVQDFKQHFPDLTSSQERQLRTVIHEHDEKIRAIRRRLSAKQFREQLAEEEAARARIRQVLTERQRAEYDKLIGRQ